MDAKIDFRIACWFTVGIIYLWVLIDNVIFEPAIEEFSVKPLSNGHVVGY